MLCYLNGEFIPRSDARISIEDRGFIFGDGVYEVWRVVEGQLFESERHLSRLASGLRELRIAEPDIIDPEIMASVAERVLRESGLTTGEATLYVEVTRGVSPRAHAFPAKPVEPTVFVMANPMKSSDVQRATGVSVITVEDVRWLRCNIKTVQLLPNVLAKQAATEKGAYEAVLVRSGIVTEGSHTNLFGVFNGEIRTHPLSNLILPGVTRAVVLELAHELGLTVREEAMRESELASADELFLTGTTTDVMPIVRVNEKTIGSGRPGPTALRLNEALRAHMDESLAAPARRVASSRG